MTLSPQDTTTTIKAKLISTTPQSLTLAGERLRAGNLVSFPTETVYGLGCHALDPIAVRKVFEAKERPFTDPLIVHVTRVDEALRLWRASEDSTTTTDTTTSSTTNNHHNLEQKILQTLTTKFWPGPLTIVALASPTVPPLLMAGTGYVACRSPSHPVARALIESSGGIPIAAPSANKFGHVSPTRARHVMDDLGEEDVWILDPELEGGGVNDDDGVGGICCDVGVESTVVKIEMEEEGVENNAGVGIVGKIVLLRHGAVSSNDILECLRQTPYDNDSSSSGSSSTGSCSPNLADRLEVIAKPQTTGTAVKHVAPGQTIRHYSPNLPSYMIASKRYTQQLQLQTQQSQNQWSQDEKRNLQTAVILDFGGRLQSCRAFALAYRDLSEGGDPKMAAANVFDALRWSEKVEDAERVYFPEISVGDDDDREEVVDALILAVKDRLTRAASGVVIDTLL